jgi:hypothetical protein
MVFRNLAGWSLLFSATAWAQPFTTEHDSLGFAQTYVGADVFLAPPLPVAAGTGPDAPVGGGSRVAWIPRLTIGGIHFWGHADFYVSFPFPQTQRLDGRAWEYSPGIETGGRVYPWRLEDHAVRPFLGFSWNPLSVRLKDSPAGKGPLVEVHRFPFQLGVEAMFWPVLVQAGLRASLDDTAFNYPTPGGGTWRLSLPPVEGWLGARVAFDTTRPLAPLPEALPKTGSLYVAAGPSSNWNLGSGTFIEQHRPALAGTHVGVMPDFAVGYEYAPWKVDAHVAWRPMWGGGASGYGSTDDTTRQAVAVEVLKIFGNFNGFQPFVGPSLDVSWLTYDGTGAAGTAHASGTRVTPGLLVGWDIRPRERHWWTLRTSLRFYPPGMLELTEPATGQTVRFPSVEFNFIQLVFFPQYL